MAVVVVVVAVVTVVAWKQSTMSTSGAWSQPFAGKNCLRPCSLLNKPAQHYGILLMKNQTEMDLDHVRMIFSF